MSDVYIEQCEGAYVVAGTRTATAAGLPGLKDPEVLAVAARDGRVLVTHDLTTMPRHFGKFVRTQRSPGLIVVPQHLPSRRDRGRPDSDLDRYRSRGVDE